MTILERTSADEFLVLACDGIWDVISNEGIVVFINYYLEVCGRRKEALLAVAERDETEKQQYASRRPHAERESEDQTMARPHTRAYRNTRNLSLSHASTHDHT